MCVSGTGAPFLWRKEEYNYLCSITTAGRGTQLEFFCLKIFVQKCLQIAVKMATCSKLDSDFVTILDIFPLFSGAVSFCLSQ